MMHTPQDTRKRLAELAAFAAVADERSFTRAAAQLGLSQSALSHAMKAMEARMGVRLLQRSTRSVSTTEAGERLLGRLRPALSDIAQALAELEQQRDVPCGTVRITTFKLAAMLVLWPMLPGFLRAHPGIQVEVQVGDGLSDIVAERFDAGIRIAYAVEKDMIGVPVGPALRLITVASPDYLKLHGSPKTPRDLLAHRCLLYRLTTSGQISPWRFSRHGRATLLKVDAALISNDNDTLLNATLGGAGITRLFDGLVQEHLDAGRLVQLLPAWSPSVPRLMLYHPSRRQVPPALKALITALRPAPTSA